MNENVLFQSTYFAIFTRVSTALNLLPDFGFVQLPGLIHRKADVMERKKGKKDRKLGKGRERERENHKQSIKKIRNAQVCACVTYNLVFFFIPVFNSND